jgi:uncharacterized lipoprotein YmbA
MKTAAATRIIHALVGAAAALAFAGCLNLKPVVHEARFFILRPVAAPGPPLSIQAAPLGLWEVIVPGHLLEKRIAIHRGNHEIRYSENLHWAERVDKNIQRVVAANLSSLLGSTHVFASAWGRDEVAAEVSITLERFEIDEQGEVLVEAHWRITKPYSEEGLHSGVSKISRQGSPLQENADRAIETFSEALAELSREIAAAFLR